MVIARELVTKISFKVDKKGVESFNRTILGFKTRMAIATAAVTGFVAGFIKSVGAVADTILATDELGKSVGIAANRVDGMKKTFLKFRIPESATAGALIKLNEQILLARQGQGQLFKEAQDGAIEIRDEFGEILPTEQILFNFLEGLGKIRNEQNARLLSQQILGSANFADLAKENREEIERLIKSNSLSSEAYKEATAQAREFDTALTDLNNTIKNFIIQNVAPVLKATATGIKQTSEFINPQIVDKVKREITEENEKFLPEFQRELEKLTPEARQRFEERQQKSIDIRNTINITVPAGTEDNQRDFIERTAQESFDVMFDDKMELIGNDFPIME